MGLGVSPVCALGAAVRRLQACRLRAIAGVTVLFVASSVLFAVAHFDGVQSARKGVFYATTLLSVLLSLVGSAVMGAIGMHRILNRLARTPNKAANGARACVTVSGILAVMGILAFMTFLSAVAIYGTEALLERSVFSMRLIAFTTAALLTTIAVVALAWSYVLRVAGHLLTNHASCDAPAINVAPESTYPCAHVKAIEELKAASADPPSLAETAVVSIVSTAGNDPPPKYTPVQYAPVPRATVYAQLPPPHLVVVRPGNPPHPQVPTFYAEPWRVQAVAVRPQSSVAPEPQ
eukprot:Opistho-1_new@58698